MFQLPNSWNLSNRLNENKRESFETWADSTRYLSEQSRADNVVRVLSFPEVSPSGSIDMIKEFDYTHNLVTNDGEIFYAKQGAGTSPETNENFRTGRFEMGTTAYSEAEQDTFFEFDVSASSKISGSRQAFTAGYPKVDDTADSDNSGDAPDAVSYAVNYSANAWNDTDVEQGCIHDNASPVRNTENAGSKLLSVFSFTSFAKTSSDTLKVFVNHAFENQ
tara:strand:+ start:31 stop:690 length:660 start_codon:yes stop_codon:yes gene_type:complete